MQSNRFKLLLLILSLKALIMVFLILYAGIGLGPDEAQYWTWSRDLDWGYYSKPPGIAWQNWLGTYFLGNTELGVRSMPLVIGFLIPLLVYAMAKACRLSDPACFWSALAIAFSPLGIMSSFLAITDGGMVLLWTATCAYLAGCVERHKTPNYFFVGLLILLGALFKWPMYILWALIFGAWFLFPQLRNWRIFGGIVISLIALLPSIYWNASHEWVTFKHVGSTILGGHAPKSAAGSSGNFFEYLGAQALLVSPILFILFLCGLWKLFFSKNVKSDGVLFCGFISICVLVIALSMSLFMKIQGNWGIFAYPTAFIVIGWYACDLIKSAKKWMRMGIALSILLCTILFSIPYLQSNQLATFLSYKINPFKHNVGWSALGKELKEVGYDPDKDLLVGDKYQTASILSFYGEGQKLAKFFNISGTRKNQFSFWPGIEKMEAGQRALFVVIENAPKLNQEEQEIIDAYLSKLSLYFERVNFIGIRPLFYVNGKMTKGAFIFECRGFLGQMPQDPNLY